MDGLWAGPLSWAAFYLGEKRAACDKLHRSDQLRRTALIADMVMRQTLLSVNSMHSKAISMRILSAGTCPSRGICCQAHASHTTITVLVVTTKAWTSTLTLLYASPSLPSSPRLPG